MRNTGEKCIFCLEKEIFGNYSMRAYLLKIALILATFMATSIAQEFSDSEMRMIEEYMGGQGGDSLGSAGSIFSGVTMSGDADDVNQSSDKETLFQGPDSAFVKPDSILSEAYHLDTEKTLRFERLFFQNSDPDVFSSSTNRVGKEYPLKAGDQIVLSMWGDVEKEQKLGINNQGWVFVRNVGKVSLNGLTLKEAEKILKSRLSKVYSGIHSGRINVALRLFKLSPIKVFVLGEAVKPGGYVVYGNTSIFQALYMAGGPSEKGSVREIKLLRDGETKQIDLYPYLFEGDIESSLVLRDGDVILLPIAKRLVQVMGGVNRTGVYEMSAQSGTADLLEYAGGLSAKGAVKQKIRVLRMQEDGRREWMQIGTPDEYLQEKKQDILEHGDIVYVNVLPSLKAQHVSIEGEVYFPGAYEFRNGMTIKNLLDEAGGMLPSAYDRRIHILVENETGETSMLSWGGDKSGDLELYGGEVIRIYSQKEMQTKDSVSISGAVSKPGLYPYHKGMSAKDLILLAGGFLPDHFPGKLRLDRIVKERTVDSKDLVIHDDYDMETQECKLKPWDHIAIPYNPDFQRPIKVKLSGAFRWPGEYVLSEPGESVKSLIERAGMFQSDAYLGGARFYRKNTQGIKYQLGLNLEKAMEGEALHNISLQNEDILHVPLQKAEVYVQGEVGYPSHVLYKEGEDIDYYIERAGGILRTGDIERIRVRYADGSIATLDVMERDPDPGSTIIIPSRPEPKPVDWIRVMSSTATVLSSVATMIVAIVTLQKLD
jgi:protein involved in polysaccharide export with SLBB domain